MAKTTWGRKETIIWPHHRPLYTYGAIVLAVVLTVLFLCYRFAFSHAVAAVLHSALCAHLSNRLVPSAAPEQRTGCSSSREGRCSAACHERRRNAWEDTGAERTNAPSCAFGLGSATRLHLALSWPATELRGRPPE